MTDDEFWLSRVSGASNPQGYQGFDEQFATALQQLVNDYERETGRSANFSSYGRTPEQGREIWERSGHGTKFLAARPGHSRHEYDKEAGRYATAADIPRGDFLDWAHQKAGNYGLSFLTGDAFRRDPVHIQLAGPPKYGSSGANSGGDYGAVSGGGGGYDPQDAYDISIRSLMGLPGRREESNGGGKPFDISILRAVTGGPLVADTRGGGREDTGPSIGGNLFGGGGSNDLIGAAYADSLDSGSGGGAQLTAAKTLSSVGWRPEEIAAAIGNAAAESTHDPSAINPSSGAVGLWQWLGDRKTGLLNFANSLGKAWSDPEVQALYLNAERTGESAQYGGANEAGNFARAFSLGGVTDMVAGFANHVERASESDIAASMARRVNGALSFLKYGLGEFTPMSATPAYVGPSGAGFEYPGFGPLDRREGYTGYGPTGGPVTAAPASPPNPPTRPPTAAPAPTEPEMPFWNEPDFNELQGGSKHAYHFDPATGRGVYRTSGGKLIAYDAESGMSSPIGERNVDAFVSRAPPKAREGGGGGGRRRIDGGSALGDASRDPVARALSDSVRPWPKEEPSKIRILNRFGLGKTGGPPESIPRDRGQIIDLLTQIKTGSDLLDYTYAIKNYADLLETTPEILDQMVERNKYAAWEAGYTSGEGGTGPKPAIDFNKVLDTLATMDPATPEYFDALAYAEANSRYKAAQIEEMIKGRKKGVAAWTGGGGVELFNSDMDNAAARNTAAASVIEELRSAPFPHDSLQYKKHREEIVVFLNSIGVAETGKNADEILKAYGL